MPIFTVKLNGVMRERVIADNIHDATHKAMDREPVGGHYNIAEIRGDELDRQIAEHVQGTCLSEHEVAESFGTTDERVLEACVNQGVERCSACDWWSDAADMLVIDDEPVCQDCNTGDEDDQ